MNVKVENLKLSSQYKRNKINVRATLTCPKAWCVRFDITPTDLMIFEEIHAATHNFIEAAYTGSRVGLCSIINGSLPTVDRSLAVLEEKGFITAREKTVKTLHGERSITTYVSNIGKEVIHTSEEIEKILEAKQIPNILKREREGKKIVLQESREILESRYRN